MSVNMQGGGSNIATGSTSSPSTELNKMKKPISGNGKSTGDVEGGKAAAGRREQEMLLPVANIIRIMRKVLPAQAKISDESKETMNECVSEFIMFVTSEANHKCNSEHRKTVTADDVIYALRKLGFDSYLDPLGLFIRRYRESEFRRTSLFRAELREAMPPRVPDAPPPPRVGDDATWLMEEYLVNGQQGGRYE